MYFCITELGYKPEIWSDVLVIRDWSMLRTLSLSNFGDT